MRAFAALFRKEISYELRSLELLSSLISISAISVIVFGLALESSFLDPSTRKSLFAPLLWVIFLFASSIATARAFEFERESKAFEALLLNGAKPWQMYAAKVLALFLWYLFAFGLIFILLGMFFGLARGVQYHLLIPTALIAIFCFSCSATLLSGVGELSRLRSAMLPLLNIPILVPVVLIVIELTQQLVYEGARELSSDFLVLLLAFAGSYAVVGLNLYEKVIRE